MSDKQNEDVEMKGHSYDGITEYDNPLPTWWLVTFFITIIFGFIYYIHYETGSGPTLKQELNMAMEEIEKHKAQAPVVMESEESLQALMQTPEISSLGSGQYAGKCAVCHGEHLQGLIGPNLTDKYWLHGKGTRMDILKVVRDGVPDKGMPAWGAMLKKEEVYAVVSYVFSKKNSQPENAKAPQGEPVE